MFRADHKHARLEVLGYLFVKFGFAFRDLVIEVNEHDDVSFRVITQLWDILIPKCLEHLGPAPCGWHDLYSRVFHLVMQHKAVRDLPIAVIFWDDIDVRRILVHGQPMISSRIRALTRSPL